MLAGLLERELLNLQLSFLQGFQYIELYSRGREELVVTVKTSLSEPQFPVVTSVLKTQHDGGPPPASPCARDAELVINIHFIHSFL